MLQTDYPHSLVSHTLRYIILPTFLIGRISSSVLSCGQHNKASDSTGTHPDMLVTIFKRTRQELSHPSRQIEESPISTKCHSYPIVCYVQTGVGMELRLYNCCSWVIVRKNIILVVFPFFFSILRVQACDYVCVYMGVRAYDYHNLCVKNRR